VASPVGVVTMRLMTWRGRGDEAVAMTGKRHCSTDTMAKQLGV